MPNVAGYIVRNYKDAAVPVGVASTVGATQARRHDKRRGVGAVAGGIGAEAAWRGVGLGVVQRAGKKRERPQEGQTRSQYQKLVSDHKKAHGVKGLQGPELRAALQRKPEYFRSYPKQLGGWRFKRALGHMSGRRGLALEAATVGAGSLYGARRVKKNDLTTDVGATAAGAVAGQGVYQGAGYGAKHVSLLRHRNAVSRSARDRRLKETKRQYGPYTPGMERHYPSSLPEWRTHRVLGWTHRGRTGDALGAASMVTGGVLAYRGAQRHGSGNKRVRKALYERERRTSPVRLAESATGAALLTYGLPRSRMLGRALERGINQSKKAGNASAVQTLERVVGLKGALNAKTGRVGAKVREVKGVNAAVSVIPPSVRPAFAIGSGALLMHQAHPVRQTHYRDVPVRGSAVTGW